MEKIHNVSFGEGSRSQESLPIKHVDLDLHLAADLSLPCFQSSSHVCKDLNRLLPSLHPELHHGDVTDAIDAWSEHHDSSPLQKGIQAAWDVLTCRDSLNTLLCIKSTWNHCLLLTAQESHIATWSETFPIATVGNLLSPDEHRIATALQTGAKIFESTKCHCRKIFDELGLHGLSCTKSADCIPTQCVTHSAINSILKRLMTHIKYNSHAFFDSTPV